MPRDIVRESLDRYYQVHGLPPHIFLEEVHLPDGMQIVVKSYRIIGGQNEETEEDQSWQGQEVQGDE